MQCIKKDFSLMSKSLGFAKPVVPVLAMIVALALAGCGPKNTTGVTQLPVPPAREVVAFNTTPPANGPPKAPVNDCKKGGSGPYRLGAGDKVRIIVPSDPDISSDYEVNSSGAITARRLGAVDVAGLSVSDLESRLMQRYRDARYFTSSSVLSVELLSTRPFYMIGEIGRQGSFPYVSCLRVIQAVALAGGFTRRASRDNITIKRFFADSSEEEYVTEDTLVEPGDVIRVPERWF
ncbi:MAG: polysaccharide export protein [Proteobacteria bacterium]|nr:polysaccharide export protein [Pseudomonadota bacterium]